MDIAGDRSSNIIPTGYSRASNGRSLRDDMPMTLEADEIAQTALDA